MTPDEFKATMDLATSGARMLLALGDQLEECLDVVSYRGALAPIVEPTAYMRGGMERLSDQERFLRAAIRFRDACEALRPKEASDVD